MKFLLFVGVFIAVFLSGCEKPDVAKATPESNDDSTPEAVTSNPVPASEPEIATKPTEQAPPPPLENAEPFVSVKISEKEIAIGGSIKSNIQKENLVKFLGEAFPEHEIADDLEVDYRRIAVGWGNRFGDGYVVPFLKKVPGGTFEYKDGVVKLTGEVPNEGTFRELVMAAGAMFAGDFTQDIDSSELIVKEE